MDEDRGLVQSAGAGKMNIDDSSCNAGRRCIAEWGSFLRAWSSLACPSLAREVDNELSFSCFSLRSGPSHIPSERPLAYTEQFVDRS
jgi:hypothetical protein